MATPTAALRSPSILVEKGPFLPRQGSGDHPPSSVPNPREDPDVPRVVARLYPQPAGTIQGRLSRSPRLRRDRPTRPVPPYVSETARALADGTRYASHLAPSYEAFAARTVRTPLLHQRRRLEVCPRLTWLHRVARRGGAAQAPSLSRNHQRHHHTVRKHEARALFLADMEARVRA